MGIFDSFFPTTTKYTTTKINTSSGGSSMDSTGGIVSGVSSLISGIVQAGLNYDAQQKQLAWQKSMYRKQLAREDTAMQRRVLDLRSAGLSPVLATGSGASAGSPVATQAPQLDFKDSVQDSAQLIANLIQMKQNIAKTKAETELIKAQQRGQGLNNSRLHKDLVIEKKSNSHSNPTITEKYFRDLYNKVTTPLTPVQKVQQTNLHDKLRTRGGQQTGYGSSRR